MTFVTPAQAAARLQVSINRLAQWRSQGRGPRFHKMENIIRYSEEDLDDFMAQHAARSTRDLDVT